MKQASANVLLKEAKPKDANNIFRAINDNRESLRVWLPFVDDIKTVDDIIAFLRKARKMGELVFTIRTKRNFAGIIGLKSIDTINKKAEIGYWLDPAFEGKGVMTSSCRCVIYYAFEELELNRILIQVAEGNYKSRKIPERLGFQEEGIERDGELLASGYTNLVKYSLLKREYDENK